MASSPPVPVGFSLDAPRWPDIGEVGRANFSDHRIVPATSHRTLTDNRSHRFSSVQNRNDRLQRYSRRRQTQQKRFRKPSLAVIQQLEALVAPRAGGKDGSMNDVIHPPPSAPPGAGFPSKRMERTAEAGGIPPSHQSSLTLPRASPSQIFLLSQSPSAVGSTDSTWGICGQATSLACSSWRFASGGAATTSVSVKAP